VVFDTHLVQASAIDAVIGVPLHVEKSGTWTNVDGIARKLTLARAAPDDVQPLVRSLERLGELLAPTGAKL
jgi:hypothetical protein